MVKLFAPRVILPDNKFKVVLTVTALFNESPALLFKLRLLNVVAPVICCAELPLKVTVFAPGINVAAPSVQLPVTLNVPDGAVKVPLFRVTLFAEIFPVEPVNVPPLTVTLQLKDCFAVAAV